jgi:hypothetical protein
MRALQSDTSGSSRALQRRTYLRRLLAMVLVLALIADAAYVLIPWWKKRGLSVIPTEQFGKVENGSVFDKAVIDLEEAEKVILPDNAKVRRMSECGKIYVFMEKQQAYHGYPPARMTLLGVRKNMGCVAKMEEDALVVATFGEWDSHIEGGRMMKIVAIIPEGVEVAYRKGLSGEGSAGHKRRSLVEVLAEANEEEDYDYYADDRAWIFPAEGWTAIPDVPDPNRIAE